MGIEVKRWESVLVLLLCHACYVGEVDLSFDDEEDAGAADASATDAGGDAGSADADASATVGDDASTEPDSGDVDLPEPEELAGLRAAGICAALEACQGAELLSKSMDGQPCQARIGGVFANRNMAHFADAVQAGRVIFRPEDAAFCVEDLAAAGCEVKSSRWRQVCVSTVKGTVDLGGACAIDEECGETAYCYRGSDGTSCPGECVVLEAEGGICSSSEQCESGLVCFGGTCEAPLVQGGNCTAVAELCKTGLLCIAGTCVPQASAYGIDLDKPCDPFDDKFCRLDGQKPLVCAEQATGSALCSERVAADALCRRSVPSQCPEGQYCEAEPNQEGRCTDLPGLYQECRPETKSRRCGPELICDTYQGSSEACVPIEDNGGTCEGDASCYSGACSEELNCVPPPVCSL